LLNCFSLRSLAFYFSYVKKNFSPKNFSPKNNKSLLTFSVFYSKFNKDFFNKKTKKLPTSTFLF